MHPIDTHLRTDYIDHPQETPLLQRWLDRDDLTDEDLHELTAEEEVLDWMVRSPLPSTPRPEWLPEVDAPTMEPALPRRRAARPMGRGRAMALVGIGVVLGASGAFSLCAVALGVYYVAG